MSALHIPALLAALALWVPARADSHALVVVGAAGDEAYGKLFSAWAGDLAGRLRAGMQSVTLLAPEGPDPSSTRAGVLAALERYRSLEARDVLFVFLIGHGSSDGDNYRVNLPGPDLTARELAEALEPIPAQVAVVNGTSASGASLAGLARTGRVVVTSTRSGRETVPPRFMGFLAEGLDGRADADKNGALSLLEAYQFARRRTAEWYQSQNLLASEHSLLDDSGDGRGTDDPAPGSTDGAGAAALWILRPESPQLAAAPPALLRRRQELEAAIEGLRFRKSSMAEADYQQELERLALELARLNRQIAEAAR